MRAEDVEATCRHDSGNVAVEAMNIARAENELGRISLHVPVRCVETGAVADTRGTSRRVPNKELVGV